MIQIKLNNFKKNILKMKKNNKWNKSEFLEIISSIYSFNHIEKGKNLDQRM